MVSPNFYPYIGGAEKQALELSKALVQAGASVSVLTRRLPGLLARETTQGILVHRTAAWGAGIINALVFLLSAFYFLWKKSSSYDVIHVHLASSPALAACIVGSLCNKRVIIKVGGGRGIGEIAVSSRSFAGKMKLMFFRIFNPQFVTVTKDLVEELAMQGLEKNACVIPNGVDVNLYSPASVLEKGDIRKDLAWREGSVLLYVGRLAPEKLLPKFLEVLKQAIGTGISTVSFYLIGAGPEEEAIKQMSRKLGIEGQVNILPPTDAIHKYYKGADIFVLPSISEGLSNSLLEAMASGLAVLASRVGGTKETIEEQKTGLLFEPQDEEEIYKQLTTMIGRPQLVRTMGMAARETALKNYSLEATARKYMDLYNRKTTPILTPPSEGGE